MWDGIEADWGRFREHARREWPRLDDGQLDAIGGRRELLKQRVRDAYGVSDDEADKQLMAWAADLREREPAAGHVTFENAGAEVGDHDRPGGAGLPSNQGGGRDAGGFDADATGADARAPDTTAELGTPPRRGDGRVPPGADRGPG